MSFVESVATCLRKYAVFSGRAPRSEFWWFMLFSLILGFVTNILDAIVFGLSGIPVLSYTAFVALILPSFAVGARRLHDTDRSGWLQAGPYAAVVLSFIALAVGREGLGTILALASLVLLVILIVWWASRSDEAENRFGPRPFLPQTQNSEGFSMGFRQAIAACFRKYAVFSGRAPRSEFWWFVLFAVIVVIVTNILDAVVFGILGVPGLRLLVSLGLFLPSLAVGARRLHDTNRSGWRQAGPLVSFMFVRVTFLGEWVALWTILSAAVFLVLFVMLIVWLVAQSDAAENRFGLPPFPVADKP